MDNSLGWKVPFLTGGLFISVNLSHPQFPCSDLEIVPDLLCGPTLCDLFPGSVEVMAGGNLSDHNQHAIVSVLECSGGGGGRVMVLLSMVLNTLLQLSSLHWGSCCDRDFHGNSATSGHWALFHLHDNCIRSKHHDNAGWGGRSGGGVAPGLVSVQLVSRWCGYLMSQHLIGREEKRDMRIYVDHISYFALLKHSNIDKGNVRVMMMKKTVLILLQRPSGCLYFLHLYILELFLQIIPEVSELNQHHLQLPLYCCDVESHCQTKESENKTFFRAQSFHLYLCHCQYQAMCFGFLTDSSLFPSGVKTRPHLCRATLTTEATQSEANCYFRLHEMFE